MEQIRSLSDRDSYYAKDGTFAVSERFRLRKRTEEDKNACFALNAESSMVFGGMNEEQWLSFSEFSWKEDKNDDAMFTLVEDRQSYELLGEIVVHHLSSDTPEIGIDVFKKWQRQGVAYESLRMFIRRFAEIRNIQYFEVRIYNDNYASQALFKKMGAIETGTEQGELDVILGNFDKLEGIRDKLASEDVLNARKRFIKDYRLSCSIT